MWKSWSSVDPQLTNWKFLAYPAFYWQEWPFSVVYIIYLFLKWHEKWILCINLFWVYFRIFKKEYLFPWMWNIFETCPIINFANIFANIFGRKADELQVAFVSFFSYYITVTVHSMFNFSCILLKFGQFFAKQAFWNLTKEMQSITSLKKVC